MLETKQLTPIHFEQKETKVTKEEERGLALPCWLRLLASVHFSSTGCGLGYELFAWNCSILGWWF